ncbi:MAG TPA: GntR family transcriptional regulator [Paludibaculum sp.]|jgi:GntR family transcriptional regulator
MMPAPPPAYRQLGDEIRKLLRSGAWQPGDRFLTERDVAERFAVSRPTANKALASLVGERILEFRKGLGTFVSRAALDYDLRGLVSFTEKAKAAGRTPRTLVLRYERLAPGQVPPDVAAQLKMLPGEAVYYLERLRLADETPVILERRHIRCRFCPGMRRASVSGSIYRLWTEQYGLEISGADQTIRAVALAAADAARLGVPPGAPGLLNLCTGYLNTQEPLWRESTLYRGDSYEFVNRLGALVAKPHFQK